ncbi:MAG: hypothetical protein ACE363_12195 [Alphaproteobacteria bacterium]
MRLTASIAVAVLLLTSPNAQAAECFADGHKWLEWDQAPADLGEVMQIGFTRGFVDTMVLWHRNAGIDPSWVASCITTKPVNDVRRIISDYVAEHPKALGSCMADLALAAIAEFCSDDGNNTE